MSHTPEPWILRQGNEIGVADKSDTQSYGMLNVIARVDKFDFENWQENARRIVACVNACAGKETEDLEAMAGKDIFTGNLFSKRVAMEKERDTYRELCGELLNAAKDYLPYMPTSSVNEGGANKHVKMLHISDALKSAITKAESILGGSND